MSGPGAEGARGLPPLAALKPGDAFPPLEAAWPADSPAPGLLAVGGALTRRPFFRGSRRASRCCGGVRSRAWRWPWSVSGCTAR